MSTARKKRLPIAVRTSTIHGSGAFATAALAPGDAIGRYAGRQYSPPEAAERDWDPALTFVFGLSDGSVIDGSEGGNATRHINHSCAPNCVAYEVESGTGQAWIEIEALGAIAPGDELFLDYSLDVDAGEAEAFSCRCGTPRCRGTMVGAAAAP
jgi:hypothetical protein